MNEQTQLAVSLFQQGKLQDAKNILLEFCTNRKDDAFAHFLLAIIYSQLGPSSEAIAYYKNAIEIQPIYPEAYNNLGVVYEKTGDTPSAESCYLQAIRQKKDHANAYYNLANVNKSKKDFDSAIENYLQAIKYNPDYSNAMNNLGLVYQYLGKYEKSKHYFEKSLNLSGYDPEILNNLGFNFYSTHQYPEALKYYQHVLHKLPDYGATLLNMGLLLQSMGQLSEARGYFEQLAYQGEYTVQARNNLANLELACGNYETGWQQYQYRPSMRTMKFSSPEKLDTDLSGKTILLFKDQGIGDEIFFARYIGLLKQTGASISYYSDDKLIPIWRKNLRGIELVHAKTSFDLYDYIVSIGDLPRLLFSIAYTEIPQPISLKPDE